MFRFFLTQHTSDGSVADPKFKILLSHLSYAEYCVCDTDLRVLKVYDISVLFQL